MPALLCPLRAEKNELKIELISLSMFQSSEEAVGLQTLLCVACPLRDSAGLCQAEDAPAGGLKSW